MSTIHQYILQLVAAAILCGIILAINGKSGAQASVCKLACGIFMTMTVVSPLCNIDFRFLETYKTQITYDAAFSVAEGEKIALEEYRTIIKANLEAYVLSKASEMGADITVEIALSDDKQSYPEQITITGTVSPYTKRVLQKVLTNDLGISTEAQLWIG